VEGDVAGVDGVVEGCDELGVLGVVGTEVTDELGVLGVVGTDVTDELGVEGGVVPPPLPSHGALLMLQALGAAPVAPVFVNSIPAAAADAPAASGPAHVGLSSR
jgi:hypothetical protein